MANRDLEQKPSPFSVRLTREERARLERYAGDMPLGAYVRSQLLDGNVIQRRRRGRRPVADQKVLAEILARLGQSRMANNLNQLARAANSGSLPLTPDSEATLRAACQDILAIKKMLMHALGIREH